MLLALMVVALPVMAMNYGDYKVSTEYNASGSTEGTIGNTTTELFNKAGRRVVIHSLIAKSDVATGVLKIYEADTTGATDNYTVKADYDIGDTSISLPNQNNQPLYVGPINTGLKLGVTSTTANSCVVIWSHQ